MSNKNCQIGGVILNSDIITRMIGNDKVIDQILQNPTVNITALDREYKTNPSLRKCLDSFKSKYPYLQDMYIESIYLDILGPKQFILISDILNYDYKYFFTMILFGAFFLGYYNKNNWKDLWLLGCILYLGCLKTNIFIFLSIIILECFHYNKALNWTDNFKILYNYLKYHEIYGKKIGLSLLVSYLFWMLQLIAQNKIFIIIPLVITVILFILNSIFVSKWTWTISKSENLPIGILMILNILWWYQIVDYNSVIALSYLVSTIHLQELNMGWFVVSLITYILFDMYTTIIYWAYILLIIRYDYIKYLQKFI